MTSHNYTPQVYTLPVTGPLWLTGYMGCGKSTLAPLFADRLNLPWLDTDDILTQRLGRSIAEVFAQDGEAAFREAERQLLNELCMPPVQPQIIATGGGFLATLEAMARAKSVGLVIYLQAPADMLWQRVHAHAETASGGRPLASQKNAEAFEAFKHRFEAREPIYSTAQIILNVAEASPEVLLNGLMRQIWAVSEITT